MFSERLWLFNCQVEDSTVWDFFLTHLAGTEHGSPPYLTTRDREMISVLEVRIEPGDRSDYLMGMEVIIVIILLLNIVLEALLL